MSGLASAELAGQYCHRPRPSLHRLVPAQPATFPVASGTITGTCTWPGPGLALRGAPRWASGLAPGLGDSLRSLQPGHLEGFTQSLPPCSPAQVYPTQHSPPHVAGPSSAPLMPVITLFSPRTASESTSPGAGWSWPWWLLEGDDFASPVSSGSCYALPPGARMPRTLTNMPASPP